MCKSDTVNGNGVVLLSKEEVVRTADTTTKKSENGYIIKDATIGEKLFQAKEDRMFLHKILGFSALASYIYRFSNLGERDGNFTGIMALVFVVHHASLNLSSFVFDIPQRRIRGGFRIWPGKKLNPSKEMVFYCVCAHLFRQNIESIPWFSPSATWPAWCACGCS